MGRSNFADGAWVYLIRFAWERQTLEGSRAGSINNPRLPFENWFTPAGASGENKTIPVGYRPAETSNVPIAVFGGNTTFILYGEHTGRVVMLGNPNSAYAGCTGVWRTTDPMPA